MLNDFTNIDKEEIEKIIKKNNIRTIVLDEAHHLRNAWWKLLSQVLEE